MTEQNTYASESLINAAYRPIPDRSIVDVPQQTSNHLLANLAPADFALIRPALRQVELPLRKQLEMRDRAVEFAYFPESGLVSVLACDGADYSVEIGVIGREGMTGMPVLLQNDHATHEVFVQIAGTAWRIDANSLRAAVQRSTTLQGTLLRYTSVMMVQLGTAALANARHTVDARVARWLLMAQDRLGTPHIPLTHELLALMLGTRRAGVTTALGLLEQKGVIAKMRKAILIKDRPALLDAAEGSYGLPEAEYARIIHDHRDIAGCR